MERGSRRSYDGGIYGDSFLMKEKNPNDEPGVFEVAEAGVPLVACASAAAPAVQYSLKIFAALVASTRSPQELEAQE
jgi:hypothetical protein